MNVENLMRHQQIFSADETDCWLLSDHLIYDVNSSSYFVWISSWSNILVIVRPRMSLSVCVCVCACICLSIPLVGIDWHQFWYYIMWLTRINTKLNFNQKQLELSVSYRNSFGSRNPITILSNRNACVFVNAKHFFFEMFILLIRLNVYNFFWIFFWEKTHFRRQNVWCGIILASFLKMLRKNNLAPV